MERAAVLCGPQYCWDDCSVHGGEAHCQSGRGEKCTYRSYLKYGVQWVCDWPLCSAVDSACVVVFWESVTAGTEWEKSPAPPHAKSRAKFFKMISNVKSSRFSLTEWYADVKTGRVWSELRLLLLPLKAQLTVVSCCEVFVAIPRGPIFI